MKDRILWMLIAFSGFTAVALGAFGAHSLNELLTPHQLTTWNKGVSYQFYHTLAAAVSLLLPAVHQHFKSKRPAVFFLLGILLFSGSLYLLACKELLGWTNAGWIGPITPIGGVLFLSGWGSLFLKFIGTKEK